MRRLIKISLLQVKNILLSKKFLICIAAAFSYSLLWLIFVHPKSFMLDTYDFEFGRFLYIIILYAGASILRNDIKFNTTKIVFAGVLSRTEVMISKVIALIFLGIVFSIIVEINSILVCIFSYKTIGFNCFLSMNHLDLFVGFTLITFLMGSLMLLIVSIAFSDGKSILFYIITLAAVNFSTAFIVTITHKYPETAHQFSVFMKTPFYTTTSLMAGYISSEVVWISIGYGIVFSILSTIIVNMREIK